MKAQKKPVIIDCIQVETPINLSEIFEWVTSFGQNFYQHFKYNHHTEEFSVKTLEGTSYSVSSDDVLIRGIKGEYYPCKKDIFEQTYETI